MNDLEKAARQALEALIWTTGSTDVGKFGHAHQGALKLLYPAIEALRQALEQPVCAPCPYLEIHDAVVKDNDKATALLWQCLEEMRYAGWNKFESDNTARNGIYEQVQEFLK